MNAPMTPAATPPTVAPRKRSVTKVASLGRSDDRAIGRWFWTVDRVLLVLLVVLIGFGLIAVAAASPAASHRYSGTGVKFSELHYFYRQLFWVAVGLPVMLGVSMLPRQTAQRLALAGASFFSVLLAVTPLIGSTVNGSTRWLGAGGFALQPSEFLKPCFIVATAWMLSLRYEDRKLPTMQLSAAVLVAIVALLLQQPDIGQTLLFTAIWLVQAVLAGLSLGIVAVILVIGIMGLAGAYFTFDHVASRIDRFLTGAGDTYQIDRSLDAFRAGGLFGTGPGEGVMKMKLPEPHTDYIFAVIGEEFGAIGCIALALVILALVVRVLTRLLDEDDPFLFLACAGLVVQFGLQAFINMGVALNLLPSKGMTLPFVSHGGSSMLALSLGMGLLLAFTRRNEYLTRSPYLTNRKASASCEA